MTTITETVSTTDADVIARDRATVDAMLTMYLDDEETLANAIEYGVDAGGTLELLIDPATLEGEYANYGPFWVGVAQHFELRVAVLTVLADIRESYPEFSAADAVEHARNTLLLPGTPYVPGGYHLERQSGSEVDEWAFDAYVLVLSATDEQLAVAVAGAPDDSDERPSSAVCPLHGFGCPMWEV